MLELYGTLAVELVVAIGVGGLIGMEREQSESAGGFAGSRTFVLISLYGALTQEFFPSLLPVALLVLAVPVTIAYVSKIAVEGDVGMTTAVATLLTFVYGAMATYSSEGTTYAVVLGTLTMALLALKGPVHRLADTVEKEERRAMLKFLLLVLVVFPLLPDENLDVLYGLNPRFVLLMVILVSGISLLAYVLTRVLGTKTGIGLTGLLGGLVSSTATSISMSERASGNPDLSRICGISIAVASVVMFPRALLEVAVVNPGIVRQVALPIGAMTLVGVAVSALVFWRVDSEESLDAELSNPFRLKTALFYGALFAVILVFLERVSLDFGETGIYVTAVVSGLADVDAITISLSKLALDGRVSETVATTGIVLAAVANTFVKAGIALVVGTPRVAKIVAVVLGSSALTGIGVVAVG